MAIETIKLKSGQPRYRVVARWGDRTLKSPCFRSHTEAKRCDVRAMDAKAMGRSPAEAWAVGEEPKASPSVQAWARDVWLPQVVLSGDRPVATATARSYVEALDVYLAAFCRPGCLTPFSELTFADFDAEGPLIISEMRAWLVQPEPPAASPNVTERSAIGSGFGRGCRPATARRYIAALSSCLSEAVSRGLLRHNPALAASRGRGGRVASPRPIRALSAVQLEHVRKAVLDRRAVERSRRLVHALFITLMYAQGLRPGEALFLRWHHVGRTALSVEGAVSLGEEKTTKTGLSRQVDLLSVVKRELALCQFESPYSLDEDLVIPRLADGLPWEDHDYRNWRKRTWKPAVLAVGVAHPSWKTLANATPYSCRHTSVTGRLYAGELPRVVAEQHGHEAGVLHQHYSHVLKDCEGEAGKPWDQQIREARASVFGTDHLH